MSGEAKLVNGAHGCGMCDGPLMFTGNDRQPDTSPVGYALVPGWTCQGCGALHTSLDCCWGFNKTAGGIGDGERVPHYGS